MRRFAELVLTLKWPIFVGIIAVTLFAGQSISRLQIDPSMETLFVKNAPEYLYYKEYRDRYGSDQMVAVAMETYNLFTQQNLRLLGKITADLERLPVVERVISLSNAMDIRPKLIGVKTELALTGVLEGEKPLDEIKREILSNELFVKNLVSENGKIAMILVYLKPPTSLQKGETTGNFIEDLRDYLKKRRRPGVKFYAAGSPVEQHDFVKLIRKDQFTFVPLIALLLIVTTFIIYRSVACVVLSMSVVGVTLIWTIGSIVITGQSLNLMTSLLGPVIMIITVAETIHFMSLFMEIRPHHTSMRLAVVLTMENLAVPTFLTHFTTVLGFLSLAVNPIPAIQSFGLFAGLGTAYSYIVSIVLTPILLPILPRRDARKAYDEQSHFFNRVMITFLEQLDFRLKWLVILLTLVGSVLAVFGVQRLEVDSNIVGQMKDDMPLAIATRFIDRNVTGVYSLGFVFRRRDGGNFMDPRYLRKIDRFKTFLESKPEIAKVNSLTTVLKKINQAKEEGKAEAYVVTDDEDLLKRYFKGIAESQDPEVWKLISPDFRELRLDARMHAVGTTEGAIMEDEARLYLARYMTDDFEYQLTGNVVLLGRMAKGLVEQQTQSFGFAFLSILIVIVVFFRSVKMGLLASIPNLFPILWVYGFMGFVGIELSTATAMVSSIVLGMVVDASIHFLHRFRYEYEHRHHYIQSLHHTYRHGGEAIFVSTSILMAGFATSIFASFRPTIYFGVLTSLTIFAAAVCTLIVLPVCLLLIKPFGPPRLFARHGQPREDEQRTHERRAPAKD